MMKIEEIIQQAENNPDVVLPHNMRSGELASVVRALAKNDKLKSLNIGFNNMDNPVVQSLAATLSTNTTLTMLLMRSCRLIDADAYFLANMLKVNITIEDMDLSKNNLTNVGITALADALLLNHTLRMLDLNNNYNITGAGVTALAGALKTNTTLEAINLFGNNVGDDGAISLAEMLLENKKLTNIDLTNCNIGDEGAIALAGALKALDRSLTIAISGNVFGEIGFRAIVDALRANPILTNVTMGGMQEIESVCLRNSLIQDLITLTRQIEHAKPESLAPSSNSTAITVADLINRSFASLVDKFTQLTDIRNQISEWEAGVPSPTQDDVEALHAHYLESAALFHLRCIDPNHDTSSIAQPDPRLLAAEDCLAQLPKNSSAFASVCFHIGQYYFTRSFYAANEDESVKLAYAKSALNFLEFAKGDPKFREDFAIVDMRRAMTAILSGQTARAMPWVSVDDDNDRVRNDVPVQAAMTKKITGEKSPPSSRAPDADLDNGVLEATMHATMLYGLNRILDAHLEELSQPKTSMSATSSRFLSPSNQLDNVKLLEAATALKELCNSSASVDLNQLKILMETIKGSSLGNSIEAFVSSYPATLADKGVGSLFNKMASVSGPRL